MYYCNTNNKSKFLPVFCRYSLNLKGDCVIANAPVFSLHIYQLSYLSSFIELWSLSFSKRIKPYVIAGNLCAVPISLFENNHVLFVFLCSPQIKVFVQGLFDLDQNMGQFKEHLRDFLVQIKVSKPTVFSNPFLKSLIKSTFLH